MYGPGCCGHSLTAAQTEKWKAEARERRHFLWTSGREYEAQYKKVA